MQRIFKYALRAQEVETLRLPIGAKPLCVQMQNHKPCLWALVDPSADTEDREIHMIGTGWPVPELSLHYISTVQLDQVGSLVFHFFIKEAQ